MKSHFQNSVTLVATALALVLGAPMATANTPSFRLDSALTHTSKGELDWKTNYKYDNQGRKIEDRGYDWIADAQAWRPSFIYRKTYDSNGNLLTAEQHRKNHITGEVNPTSLTEYTYDEEGLPIQKLYLTWDSEKNDWRLSGRNTMEYDGGLLATTYTYTRFVKEQEWRESGRSIFYYDGNQLQSVTQQSKQQGSDTEWEDSGERINTYDAQGNLLESTSTILDRHTNTSRLISQSTYKYNAAGQQTEISLNSWSPSKGKWVTHNLDQTAFDEKGRVVEQAYYISARQDDGLKGHFKRSYTYTSLGTRAPFPTYYWNEELNQWNEEPDTETEIFYSPIQNPFAPEANVGEAFPYGTISVAEDHVTVTATQETFIQIVSISGIIVTSQRLNAGDQVDIYLPEQGVYILSSNNWSNKIIW